MNTWVVWILALVLGGIITYLITLITKSKKDIQLLATQYQSTLTITEEIKSDTKILYKGEQVEQMDRVDIIITNRGNVSIDGSEIKSPITLSVPEGAKILKHDLVQSHDYIEAHTTLIDETGLNLQFTVLKPKDTIRVPLICSDLGERLIECSGRILGLGDFSKQKIHRIERPLESFRDESFRMFFFLLASIAFCLMLKSSFYNTIHDPTIFPRKNWSSFRRFRVIAKEPKIEVSLVFRYYEEEKLGLIAQLERSDIPSEISDDMKALVDRALGDEGLKVSFMDVVVSGLDSLAIMQKSPSPKEIESALQDSLGKAFLEVETWSYEPMSTTDILRKLTKQQIIKRFLLPVLLLLVSLGVVLSELKNARKHYSILSTTERNKTVLKTIRRVFARFEITEQSLENLEREGVPTDVLEKLETIKNQKVVKEEEFLGTLRTTIGEEQAGKLKSLILKHAKC